MSFQKNGEPLEEGSPDGLIPAQRGSDDPLADRIAAAVADRGPGWQLPYHSALARRYHASVAQIDSAIGDLVRRSLIRKLPDGRAHRVSATDDLIPVEGIGGLGTRLDPMGAEITCHARHVRKRAVPPDVASALGVEGGTPVRTVSCVWAVDGVPAAVSTAYVLEACAGSLAVRGPGSPAGSSAAGAGRAVARAAELELAPPQPAVRLSLGLREGQPAFRVTLRFDDPAAGTPASLAVVVLKPDRFRVEVEVTRDPDQR